MWRYGTLIAWAEKPTVVMTRSCVSSRPVSPFTRSSSASWKRGAAHSICCPRSARRPPLAAHVPERHRNDQPGQRSGEERAGHASLHQQREGNRKRQHADCAERGPGGVERGGLLPTPLAGEARFSLAADLMLLDQSGARAEDGGKGQKEASDRGTITAAD